MGKIIFLDVDGTLVDYENHLPESAVLAVRKARENGHRVYICTGRSKAEVYENIWEIGLDGMIGGNGSYVEDHGHVVMHQMITPEQCRHIVDWLKERGLEFYLESNAGLFASAGFEEAGEPVIQEYSRRKGKEGADKIKVRDVFPEMIFDGELYRDDVNKVSFILNQYQDYKDAVVETHYEKNKTDSTYHGGTDGGGIHDRLRCENSGDHSGFGDNDSSRDDGGRDNNCGGDGWEGVPDQTACSIFKRLR